MSDKTWIEIQNEPVKAIKKLNLKLAASQRIRDDNGLTMMSITGKQQGGKSSYAMRILQELYNNDVDAIMNHIVFSVEELTEKLYNAINGGYRERCILFDDASVTGSAASWVTDPKGVILLSGLGDTLGVAVKGLLITSPTSDLIKSFRNYPKYIVQIHKGRHEYDRVARGYWIGNSPMMQKYCQAEFEDTYDTRIHFYERYAARRRELSFNAITNMKEFLNKDKESCIKEQPLTIKEKVLELKRDLDAGVFGDMTFKSLCKANKINYCTAKNYI